MNIKNKLGLSIGFLENGSIENIDLPPVRMGVRVPSPFSKSGTNLFLRKRTNPYIYTPLLGPESNSSFAISKNKYIARGSWEGLQYACLLQISEKSNSWQWSIDVKNTNQETVELDIFYVQDAGLKTITNGLNNEYYVSQYLERRILKDKTFGSVICCRQNIAESTGNPSLIIACKNKAFSASVDGMQFYGKTYRETGIEEGLLTNKLLGEYAGESTVLALQSKPFKLNENGRETVVFISGYLPNHPSAISESDLEQLSLIMKEFDETPSIPNSKKLIYTDKNLFNTSSFLPVDELSKKELTKFFGSELRHIEEKDGQLLSFFCAENNHVALKAKEINVDRPHAHIMQAKAGYAPNENIVSTTSYAYGVFNSHVTQGNTNFNIFLSICSSQFNLACETGQRIFAELDGVQYLLGVPSAFEMGLNHCRWIYKHGKNCFQVRTWTSKKEPKVNLDFKVISGDEVKLLVSHHFDPSNNWKMSQGSEKFGFVARPAKNSMIAGKFPDAQFRILVNSNSDKCKAHNESILYPENKNDNNSLFILEVEPSKEFCMSIVAEVSDTINTEKISDADSEFHSDCREAQNILKDLSLNLSVDRSKSDPAAIQEILPWYYMNALTHYLTPYGLEQFSGAAWGTRDVSQGPFDLLLSMGKYEETRQILGIIFANQNTDGGWPQWWMFDSYNSVRADHSHGDVFYWVIIALSNYIKVTGDLKILDEEFPYFSENQKQILPKTPIREHIDRLIKMIVSSFVSGTALIPYGNGDWNDSLQPVSKELAQRMISSWTVEMNYQAFMQYEKVFEQTGEKEKARELREICEKIKTDFNKYLIKNEVVAGYGLVESDGSISLLLHPDDTKTNIQYSILPMSRGVISGIFTKEQALTHQDLIEKHLKGPDGARLMNRPLKYKGGIQTIFQRAESSTFFGREIGLMYVHEHIRYAESQAITGKPEAFLKALRQAIPVGYKQIVPSGDFRQSNCYYSSSDVSFRSRYEADELYDEIKTGKISLKGGWRVYSSGPGIYIGLIVTRLIGLRTEYDTIILDPVLPLSLDGFIASIDYAGRSLKFIYEVKESGFSPKKISVNNKPISFSYEENKYRKGGAVIPKDQFIALLDKPVNSIKILL